MRVHLVQPNASARTQDRIDFHQAESTADKTESIADWGSQMRKTQELDILSQSTRTAFSDFQLGGFLEQAEALEVDVTHLKPVRLAVLFGSKLIGTAAAPRLYQALWFFVLLSGIVVVPFIAVWSKDAVMYPNRHTSFGWYWTICSTVCALCGMKLWINQRRALHPRIEFLEAAVEDRGRQVVKRGHMLYLLADVNWEDPKATVHLNRWLKSTPWIIGLGLLYTLPQAPMWFITGWFFEKLKENVFTGLIWIWFYVAVQPIWVVHISYAVACVGIANAASAARLSDACTGRGEKNSSGAHTSSERAVVHIDDIMDTIVAMNTHTLPTNMSGWGSSFMILFSNGVGLAGGLAMKALVERNMDGIHPSLVAQDLESACGLLLVTFSSLFVPAQTTTACNGVRVEGSLVLLCQTNNA